MASVAELLALHPQLADVSDSAALDVSLLLSHCLQRPREFLYAHPEYTLDEAEKRCFEALFERRRRGEPVAHLLGRREFWSLDLAVTADTLIPRPDTERLVELALAMAPAASPLRVLDLGTGSGAIALALAVERPAWQVLGVDVSPAAVAVARDNAARLQAANIGFLCSDWFEALAGRRFELIVANPPYIAPDDPHLAAGDVRFEPRSALIADNRGLAAIEHIVDRAPGFLAPGGLLALEHGHEQGAAVRSLLQNSGFVAVNTVRDYGNRERVTHGRAR